MARLIDLDSVEFLNVEPKRQYDKGFNAGINSCINRLVNAPTVDAKPVVHAMWIGTEYDGYADGNPVYEHYACSNCGAEFQCEDMDFDYCPRCGAKMIEPQESEDGDANN